MSEEHGPIIIHARFLVEAYKAGFEVVEEMDPVAILNVISMDHLEKLVTFHGSILGAAKADTDAAFAVLGRLNTAGRLWLPDGFCTPETHFSASLHKLGLIDESDVTSMETALRYGSVPEEGQPHKMRFKLDNPGPAARMIGFLRSKGRHSIDEHSPGKMSEAIGLRPSR